MKHLVMGATCAALLAACGTMGVSGAAQPIAEAAMSQPARPAMEFVQMAASSDLYEIQSSQLVMQTSSNDDLRRFAQMMIDHHTQTTATVNRAAMAAGLAPPPPALMPRHAQMIQQLQAATGMARDQLYRQQQVMAHQEALTLHASYAESGDRAELRAAAATAVPVVARHYNEISAMSGGAGMDHSGH